MTKTRGRMRVLRTPPRGDLFENAQQVRSRVRSAQQNEKLFKKLRLSKRHKKPTKRNAKRVGIDTIATLKTGPPLPATRPKLLQAMANGLSPGRPKRVKWRFLPPGKRPFAEIICNLDKAAKKYGKEIYEIERLTRIEELGPTETWIGDEGFRGYVAFVFVRYNCVVLECPRTNNAAYIFGENWKSLSRLTKSELLNTRQRELERVIHTDGWFFRLTKLLADRRSH